MRRIPLSDRTAKRGASLALALSCLFAALCAARYARAAFAAAAASRRSGYVCVEGHYAWDHYTYDGQGAITGCVYYWAPDLKAQTSNSHYSCDPSGWGHWNVATSGYAGGACSATQTEDTTSGTSPHLRITYTP